MEKKETAMSQMINLIKEHDADYSILVLLNDAILLLEVEKEQLLETLEEGYDMGRNADYNLLGDYYINTYGE